MYYVWIPYRNSYGYNSPENLAKKTFQIFKIIRRGICTTWHHSSAQILFHVPSRMHSKTCRAHEAVQPLFSWCFHHRCVCLVGAGATPSKPAPPRRWGRAATTVARTGTACQTALNPEWTVRMAHAPRCTRMVSMTLQRDWRWWADGAAHAVCFVCRLKGHLSRNCPSNPNGCYPKARRLW